MVLERFSTALQPRWRLIVSLLVAIIALVAVGLALNRWAAVSAVKAARFAAMERMRANAGLFESELQKYRLLPLVLAESSDVILLVQDGRTDISRQLNVKLRQLAQSTGIDVIYVINAKGTTLAASNFDLPTSFVGQNYTFRPYFRQALAGQNAEFFALGAVSNRPGLFVARPIARGKGVVVAKISFDKLESGWSIQSGPTLIRDRYGVVTVASNLSWVLRTTRPLPPNVLKEAERTLQFGASKPTPLAFALPPPRLGGNDRDDVVELAPELRYVMASKSVSIADWTLTTLEPLGPALGDANARARVIGLVAMLVFVVAFGLWVRSAERRRLLVASRQMLEGEVKRRTAELRGANEQLVAEVNERERTSRHLRKARDELAQANRLGSIGQITAGVAHEINQPVAAIRAFAENAKVFIERHEFEAAERNVDLIVDLTSRIGRITSELRSFARRDTPLIGEVNIGDALEGALILIGDRPRAEGVSLVLPGLAAESVTVLADRVRLEQVIINLLQNSLDALMEVADRRIEICLEARPDAKEVALIFDDSGPGIPAALRTTLFKPFVTGKKNGLGLGLGIAQDIVREFGGELLLTRSTMGGTSFKITLLKP